mmetsp:Transcript_5590/g.7820  ORF Transcript_5590/g.7820 Transcript_5590/m.7820 type:complete len:99 (-) Transcript_5590:104-400(-)
MDVRICSCQEYSQVEEPYEQPHENENLEPKMIQRKNKLEQITGRKSSLKNLVPFIFPENSEQAIQMGRSIQKSDKMKNMFGVRPDPSQISASEPKTVQ